MLPMIYRSDTNMLSELYPSVINMLPMFYISVTNMLPEFYPSVVSMLPMFYRSFPMLPVFHGSDTNMLSVFYRSVISMLPMFYRSFTDMFPMFYRSDTNVLSVFYRSFANMLPMFYQSSTNILPMFYRSVTGLSRNTRRDAIVVQSEGGWEASRGVLKELSRSKRWSYRWLQRKRWSRASFLLVAPRRGEDGTIEELWRAWMCVCACLSIILRPFPFGWKSKGVRRGSLFIEGRFRRTETFSTQMEVKRGAISNKMERFPKK